MAFCKEYNARTAAKIGELIPAEITVYSDNSFKFILKSPPTTFLIKRAAGVEKGSGESGKKKVGKLTRKQVQEIAEVKMPDLNALDMEAAMKQIEGTARNMGITVEG